MTHDRSISARALCLLSTALVLFAADALAQTRPPKGGREEKVKNHLESKLKGQVQRVEEGLAKAEQLAAEATAAANLRGFGKAKSELFDTLEALETLQADEKFADHPDTLRLAAAFEEKQKAIWANAEPFLEQALAKAEVPADLYEGEDKEKMRKGIVAAWKERWPQDQVLGVCFHKADWQRNQKGKVNRADGSVELTDRSTLSTLILVKQTDKIATMFGVPVYRDNLSESYEYFVDTKSNYSSAEVLAAKVK